LFSFRVLRAAMLTQPPIAEVEEVSGLVHWNLRRGWRAFTRPFYTRLPLTRGQWTKKFL